MILVSTIKCKNCTEFELGCEREKVQKLVTFCEQRLTHNGQIGRALDRDGIPFGRHSKLLSIQVILKGREPINV